MFSVALGALGGCTLWGSLQGSQMVTKMKPKCRAGKKISGAMKGGAGLHGLMFVEGGRQEWVVGRV